MKNWIFLRIGALLAFLSVHRKWILLGTWVLAYILFEIFNTSATSFAMSDLLGEGNLLVIILTLGFWGIDFPGVFSALNGPSLDEWEMHYFYLVGAWFVAAVMNAFVWGWGFALLMPASVAILLAVFILAIRVVIILPMFAAAPRQIIEGTLEVK